MFTMFTSCVPSVSITPVYTTAKQPNRQWVTRASLPTVTVQVEPVDLSTKRLTQQHGHRGVGHHPGYKGIGQGSQLWELRPFLETDKEVGCKEKDMEVEKLRTIVDWSKNKKIHKCNHPGCDKAGESHNSF